MCSSDLVLATSAPQRIASMPDVPTFTEVGLPGIDVMPWQGFLAPAQTPRAIIMQWNTAINNVLKEADMVQRLAVAGSDVLMMSPEALAAKIRKELAYFEKVIRTAKIKPSE